MADAVNSQQTHKMSKYREIMEEKKKSEQKQKSDNSILGMFRNAWKGEEKKESGKILSVKK